MMGAGHRALGAVCASSALALDAHDVGLRAGVLVVVSALATSSGALSPDVDQEPTWRALTRGRRAFSHRCLTHWWPVPLAMWWASSRVGGDAGWLLYGAAIGWGSHLLGDVLCGRSSLMRGPGIPTLWPTGPHLGLGCAVGGQLETLLEGACRRLSIVAVPLAVLLEWRR